MTNKKESIKYFVMAAIILVCLYSNKIADLLIPVFDDIYYGNLVNIFLAIVSAAIWGIEVAVILFACKKFNIDIFNKKEEKKELSIWQIIVLFVLTVVPMLIISACIGWKVKIVHDLGEKVTLMVLGSNVCQLLSFAVRMILMIMIIACVQRGFEIIVNKDFSKFIPYGGIFAIITFGIIDFFVLAVPLRAFYLVMSLLYGVIYMLADKKFSTTWILCYLIYLL